MARFPASYYRQVWPMVSNGKGSNGRESGTGPILLNWKAKGDMESEGGQGPGKRDRSEIAKGPGKRDRSEIAKFGDSTLAHIANSGPVPISVPDATWYEKQIDYGFPFDRPKEVARFIDVFCRREHHLVLRHRGPGFRVYALAPYSTIIDSYKKDFRVPSSIKKRRGKVRLSGPSISAPACISRVCTRTLVTSAPIPKREAGQVRYC